MSFKKFGYMCLLFAGLTVTAAFAERPGGVDPFVYYNQSVSDTDNKVELLVPAGKTLVLEAVHLTYTCNGILSGDTNRAALVLPINTAPVLVATSPVPLNPRFNPLPNVAGWDYQGRLYVINGDITPFAQVNGVFCSDIYVVSLLASGYLVDADARSLSP